MSYTAWSVVFGEQPSAAKWNILGTNDAGFRDGSNISWTSTPTIGNGLITNKALTIPYKFMVRRTAAANSGNAAFAVLSFDTEITDTGNNVLSGVFTAPVAGFYAFGWGAQATVTGASQTFIASLFVNGTESVRGGRALSNGAGILGSTGSVPCIALALNDTVDTRTFGTASFALDVGGTYDNFFSGTLMSVT